MKSPDRDAADERTEAIVLANRILDRINADPDDDLAVLARQFLRSEERASELATLRRRERDKDEAIRRFLDMIEARPDVRALFGLAEGHVLDLAWQAISPARRNSDGEWITAPLPPGRNEG